jgi:hypothetical protein
VTSQVLILIGLPNIEKAFKNINDRSVYQSLPVVLPDIICSLLTALIQSPLPVYASTNIFVKPLNACTLPHSDQILETKAVLELS